MEIVGGKPYKLRALLFDNPAPDGATCRPSSPPSNPSGCGRSKSARRSRRATERGPKWHYILTVVRYEKRTGPGDAMIDTFVIEMTSRAQGRARVSRWWISPADKFAIRYDFSDGAGKANRALVTSVTH